MNWFQKIDYMGHDPDKWADEFCKEMRDNGHDLDKDDVVEWFAAAIADAGHEACKETLLEVLGDDAQTREDIERIFSDYNLMISPSTSL